MPVLPEGLKWVPGYEGRYAVSTLGECWSYAKGRPRTIGKEVTPGRYTVHLTDKDKPGVRWILSRLIHHVFNGPIPEGYEVDHINGDKYDNRPDNLQALTPEAHREKTFREGNHRTRYEVPEPKPVPEPEPAPEPFVYVSKYFPPDPPKKERPKKFWE